LPTGSKRYRRPMKPSRRRTAGSAAAFAKDGSGRWVSHPRLVLRSISVVGE
jgi:hypothetical protein